MQKIVIAITGASGSVYSRQLLTKLQCLNSLHYEISVVVTDNAKQVWQTELDEEFKVYESKLNHLKTAYQDHSPEESILRRFERLFVKHTWAFYALSNLDYKSAINRPLINIVNNINPSV